MAGSGAKDRVVYPLQKWVVNPVVILAHNLGIPPPGDALLETTGRRTGLPRRTPVCDGLGGERFWLVAQPVLVTARKDQAGATDGHCLRGQAPDIARRPV